MEQSVPLKKLVAGRFRGAVLGVGIGNALAFPHLKNSRSFIRAIGDKISTRYEKHRSGYFPMGQYSEETQLLLAACESYAEQGRLDLDDIAARLAVLWRENGVIGRSEVLTEAAKSLVRHERPPASQADTGEGLSLAIAAGLWNHDEPDRLPVESSGLVGVVRRRPAVLAAANAVAATTAFCLTHREMLLGDLVDATADAAEIHHRALAKELRDLPRYLATPEPEALKRIHDASQSVGDVGEDLLLVLYYFLRAPEDFVGVLRGVLRTGKRGTLRASLAGGLSGAFLSASRLPPDLVHGVVDSDYLSDSAEGFYAAKASSSA